jgi:hypothetical protein
MSEQGPDSQDFLKESCHFPGDTFLIQQMCPFGSIFLIYKKDLWFSFFFFSNLFCSTGV